MIANHPLTLLKFADHTTLVGLIKNENEDDYRTEINELQTWCDNNNQLLNQPKTIEIVIDFRKNQTTKNPVFINNTEIEKLTLLNFLVLPFQMTLNGM